MSILFFLFVLAKRIQIVYDYNENVEGLEHTFVFATQQNQNYGTIYFNPENFPYSIYQYVPVYFDLVSSLVNDTIDPRPIYIIGRWINLIANLFTAVFVFLFCGRIFKLDLLTSLTAALISFTFFYAHAYAFRPDSLKILLSFISLFLIVLGTIERKYMAILAGSFFGALCLFTKQDGFLLGFVCLIFFIYYKDFKACLYFILGYTFCLIILALIYIYPNAENFYLNVVVGLNQGISFDWFRLILRLYYQDLYLLIFTLSIIIWATLTTKSEGTFKALLLVTIVYLFFEIFGMLKWGSTFVYLSEAILLSFILATVCVVRLIRLYSQRSFILSSYFFFTMFLSLIFIDDDSMNRYWPDSEKLNANKDLYQKKLTIGNSLRENWLSTGDLILSFDKGLNNFISEYVIFGTYEVEYPDFMRCDFNYPFQPNRIFTYDQLFDDINAGKVQYLISRNCDQIERFF